MQEDQTRAERKSLKARALLLLKSLIEYWPHAAVWLVLFAIIIIFRSDAVLGVFRLEAPPQSTYTDKIKDNGAKAKKDGGLNGDYEIVSQSIALLPNGNFRVNYVFDREPDERVFLMLRFFWRPYLATRMTILPEGGRPATAANRSFYGSPPLDLTQILGDAKRFQITLEAQASADAPAQPTSVFDSIVLRRSRDIVLPDLPTVMFALVVALALFYALPRLKVNKLLARIAISGSILAVLLIASRFAPTEKAFFVLALLSAVGLWTSDGRERLKTFQPTRATQAITLLFILAIGVMLRWHALGPESGKQIEPDAEGYIRIARSLAGPFQSDMREPALIWWVWMGLRFFVDHEVALRVMSCLLAVVAAGLTFGIGRRVMPAPLALIAALLVVLSEGFITQNIRGLRLEGYIISLLLLSLGLLWMPKKAGPIWIASVGIAAGFVVISNLSALSFCTLFLIYFGLRRRWKWWWWPIPFILMFIIATPYLHHLKVRLGDPFYTSNIAAKFYRNQEFKGQPGYPTVEEVNRDSFAGPNITTADYFFKHHTIGEVIGRTIKGFAQLYLFTIEDVPAADAPHGPRKQVASSVKDYVLDGRMWVFVFYLIGLIVAIARREFDLLVIFLGINLTSFFLAATPGIFFDPRLYLHYTPFVCLFPPMAFLAWPTWRWWKEWWIEKFGDQRGHKKSDKKIKDDKAKQEKRSRRRPRKKKK